jgi:hypothetical protein
MDHRNGKFGHGLKKIRNFLKKIFGYFSAPDQFP